MICICEFELFQEEGGAWVAIPFGGLGCATEGADFRDAVEMAADALRIVAEDALMRGEDVPEPPLGNRAARGGRVVAVAVDADLRRVESVTAAEAARMLEVSRPRVTQLCDAGLLESWHVGRTRMVSRASVEARMAEMG